MVWAPRHLIPDPGRRAQQMVLNIDLAPSLLEAAGAPIPNAMQGESFLPLLDSESAPGRKSWDFEMFRDFPFGGRVPPHKAIRTERYKYIEWECCREKNEVYDLREDPREMKNPIDTDAGGKLIPPLKSELESLKRRYHLVDGAEPARA
ncbi:MAG: DUF4976 domain-containing protein [Proteobacteria bacterium]|nr:DUF4976 domain-containing protein [Pseudomonadota bacterium]